MVDHSVPPEKFIYFSYEGVITVCVCVTVILLLLSLLVQSNIILRKTGVSAFIFLICLVVARVIIPIELGIAYDVVLFKRFELIDNFFHFVLLREPVHIQLWHLFIAMWLVVSVFLFVKRITKYIAVARFTRALPAEDWDELFSQYDLEKNRFDGIEKIKLVYFDGVSSPCLIGVKNPCILIPNMSYTKEQMKYVILHEYMHVINKDIYLKMLLDTVCSFIWWNPLFYYVKHKLFFLIEMRNDAKIADSLSEHEQVSYMESLKDTAVMMAGSSIAYGLSFNKNSLKELKRRLSFVATTEKTVKVMRVVVCSFFIMLWLLSWTFLLEPYNFPEDNPEEMGTPMTMENTILIDNGDGTYQVYADGMYIFTTDEEGLRAFPLVPIYNSLEEVP